MDRVLHYRDAFVGFWGGFYLKESGSYVMFACGKGYLYWNCPNDTRRNYFTGSEYFSWTEIETFQVV